ncbi:DUF1616 domain-containing protein [Chloroflexota bacterium]
MTLRIKNELILLNLLVIVLILTVVFSPSNVLRVILGIPIVLFFPGYALMAALFPRKERMGSTERVALSLVMSMAIVPLIGLILYITQLGIRLESIVYSLASFIFIMSVIAWLRRNRLLEEERFAVEFCLAVPGWSGDTRDKVLSITLVVAILGALGIIGYVIATPKVEERFTEFYILRPEGETAVRLKQPKVGEAGEVVMVITNHEYHTVSYLIQVRIDGMINNEIGPILLEHGEKSEEEVVFVPQKAGDNQKLELLLYKEGDANPYSEPLRLWFNAID